MLLFNPAPRSGWKAHKQAELPLGLLYPATPLARKGYRVTIVDQFADPRWEARLLAAMAEKPVCFGVTCMTGPQILHALAACRLVRARHPDVPIVWGGTHATLLPEQTLESPFADIVVIGEGEVTLLELVEALQLRTPLDRVLGIGYRKDGRYHHTGPRPFVNLDEQPPLAYQLVDIGLYRRNLFGVDHVSLNTSRGCSFNCRFCWDPVVHRRQFRAMQPGTVLEHMRRIVADYGVRGFLFTDDNFFVDMDRAHGILEEVVRADLGLCIGKLQVRADTICRMEPEFLDLMVRAGVRQVTVGAESGSPRMLELVRKLITPDIVLEANCRLRPYPIAPLYLFMMGLPGETVDDFSQTLRLAERLTDENPRAAQSFNIYTPYPGTELFDVAVSCGLRPPDRLEGWAGFNFRSLPKESPWISPALKKLIAALDFPLMASQWSGHMASYTKMSPIAAWLLRAYAPLARYRIRRLDGRFPLDARLARALGVFARQD